MEDDFLGFSSMRYDSFRPHDEDRYERKERNVSDKRLHVPKFYLCNRCKQGGHHVLQCPTNEDPRFDVTPNSHYVCMYCGTKGDHYRMFCPKNPEPDSVYRRRQKLGVDGYSRMEVELPSRTVTNANLIPLGDTGKKRRFRSNSDTSTESQTLTAFKETNLDEIKLQETPSPDHDLSIRVKKKVRFNANPLGVDNVKKTAQNAKDVKGNSNNEPINSHMQSNMTYAIDDLFKDVLKITPKHDSTRLTALDMWEVNDVRRLRRDRLGDDQPEVPLQEDIERFLEVKEVYEKGGEAWENAFEELIVEAYRQVHESHSDEVEAQVAREARMYDSIPPAYSLRGSMGN